MRAYIFIGDSNNEQTTTLDETGTGERRAIIDGSSLLSYPFPTMTGSLCPARNY
jgi:hypothetical protein